MEYSPRHGRFRALLRQIREDANLTQHALAQKLGKPQSFVSKAEIGERSIDFLETVDFCTACNASIAELVEQLQQDAAPPRSKRRSARKTAD